MKVKPQSTNVTVSVTFTVTVAVAFTVTTVNINAKPSYLKIILSHNKKGELLFSSVEQVKLIHVH